MRAKAGLLSPFPLWSPTSAPTGRTRQRSSWQKSLGMKFADSRPDSSEGTRAGPFRTERGLWKEQTGKGSFLRTLVGLLGWGRRRLQAQSPLSFPHLSNPVLRRATGCDHLDLRQDTRRSQAQPAPRPALERARSSSSAPGPSRVTGPLQPPPLAVTAPAAVSRARTDAGSGSARDGDTVRRNPCGIQHWETMLRAKEGRQKAKGAALPVVPILQKFLRTYEKHCAQTRTSVCPAIKRDLKAGIDNGQILRKFFLTFQFILVRPDDSPPSIPPISLEPLLMTIREECYTLGKEICIWGLQLSNPEIARLALLLELKGRSTCPFTTLELVDCKMDPWSLGRLGEALQFSSLHSLVLDYCNFGIEEIERIFSGLENNQRLQGLSLRYCGLGPRSGPALGSVVSQSAVRELHLDGNYLQCSGALALLRPLAEYAEMQGKGWPTTSSPDARNPPQLLGVSHRASSTLNPITKSSGAVTVKTTSGKNKRKKGIKKKVKGLTEAGPWLVKLHLADNGIDGKGNEGEKGLLEFTQILTCLIKYSAHLREIDLGNNGLGERAAADILEALRARKAGKLPVLKLTVTPQISSDTFRSIWKNSKKSYITRKKKKKVKN
ncbi:uncharacterized protein [Equus przewalskii]|uniref:Uncharacterized protein n=1 Tax=Equus przewalskii TaxID=9798 RepID=A0ABM4L075_EQUPR